ncbi:MAG: Uma2 family endonuclease [Cyanobacteria bacterium SBLK]|nr:Uma2 family endonuclease [Cyanobacteria bacterium SBLK]
MQAVAQNIRWTVRDLELLPENEGIRYEIIEGELFMARAPHSRHQQTCGKIFAQLDCWSEETGLGEAILSPGVLFSDADNVIPDVVWVARETYDRIVDDRGHLTGAPELAIEVLSTGERDRRRDMEVKLKLYSMRGVIEYWIVDWRARRVEVYCRENGQLRLARTLLGEDRITSTLLPDFCCPIARFFPNF